MWMISLSCGKKALNDQSGSLPTKFYTLLSLAESSPLTVCNHHSAQFQSAGYNAHVPQKWSHNSHSAVSTVETTQQVISVRAPLIQVSDQPFSDQQILQQCLWVGNNLDSLTPKAMMKVLKAGYLAGGGASMTRLRTN